MVEGTESDDRTFSRTADIVLVSVGVRPDTELLVNTGATTGPRGAVAVDEQMRTGLADVYAAGDCVVTHHRLLGVTYLPPGDHGAQAGTSGRRERRRR